MNSEESRTWFVEPGSIVRTIWGRSDFVLFIFAGAAAEFSLNKAVDWLFFTGRLPADPLGRLFSTVTYARLIVFSPLRRAHEVIDRMSAIHHDVENKRGTVIPDWAYRDVLYMLIDYSIRSYELLARQLRTDEKAEVYSVFRRVGQRMQIPSLPSTYQSWLNDREKHMKANLDVSDFTRDLYNQYRLHLGPVRYRILLGAQAVITPPIVKHKLRLSGWGVFRVLILLYKFAVVLRLDGLLKKAILPSRYVDEVRKIDQ